MGKYKFLGMKLDREFRNNLNSNFEDVSSDVSNLQGQVNQLVVSGDSSVEAAQARIDKFGNSHTTLKVRVDLLEQRINVRSFGAVQDGVTDDSPAIQAALDSLNGSKGVIYIPYTNLGTLIGSTIQVPSNVKIVGDGTRLISKLNEPVGGGTYPTCIFVNDDDINGNESISIEGFILDGNQSASVNGYLLGVGVLQDNLLRMVNVNGFNMKDVTIQNVQNNKEDAPVPPDTFYVAFISDCEDVKWESVVSTGHVNSEGIRFINCNKVHLNHFTSDNDQVWTPLHFYYCDGFILENSTIIEDRGRTWDASTINAYSKNVRVTNCTFIGGKGIDFSDEQGTGAGFVSENVVVQDCYIEGVYGFYTSLSSIIKNFHLSRLRIKSNLESINFYAMKVDKFSLRDSTLETLDGTKKGFAFDTREGAYLHSAVIENNIFTNHNTGVFLTLRNGLGFKDITISGNQIKPSTLGAKSDFDGASGGIYVYLYDSDAMVGNYLERMFITRNKIDAEGSGVVFRKVNDAATNMNVKEVEISKNKIYSTRLEIKRGIQVRSIDTLRVLDNEVIDGGTTAYSLISYSKNIFLQGNKITPKTQGLGWRFESNTGTIIALANVFISNPASSRNHFYSDAGNTFSSKSITSNLPNTSDANV